MIRTSFQITSLMVFLGLLFSCKKQTESINVPKTMVFEKFLSSYNVYQGTKSELTPANDFHEIELASSLFVNYAQKQRLIKLPNGQKIKKIDQGLPLFPEGTILVKTFFYYNNESNQNLGKQIIETRLLIKHQEKWNVATYVWNVEQTEATLKSSGLSKTITWVDQSGQSKTVQYQIPSEKDCFICHQSNNELLPLGPTLTHMNVETVRNGFTVNQLQYFQDIGMMEEFNHADIPIFPDYFDENFTLAERGRAYFEMNCAHCHNPNGFEKCASEGFDFRYITPLANTKILPKQDKIVKEMEKGDMPWIGTETIDEEGLLLIKHYMISI